MLTNRTSSLAGWTLTSTNPGSVFMKSMTGDLNSPPIASLKVLKTAAFTVLSETILPFTAVTEWLGTCSVGLGMNASTETVPECETSAKPMKSLGNDGTVIHSNFDPERNDFFKEYLKKIYPAITTFRSLDSLESA